MEIAKNDLFFLDDYLENEILKRNNGKPIESTSISNISKKESFYKICEEIQQVFDQEWETENGKHNDASDKLLDRQRRAIIGYEQEVSFFKSKIEDYLKKRGIQDSWCPPWYSDLVSGIFHENWGLAGVAAWKEIKDSSSCKVIGDRIYFLINGRQVLQEQTISSQRFDQLKRALLLRTPEIRIKNQHYAEVPMLDGTRIIIFDEGRVKQPSIIFRKDIVNFYTFEEQAKRNTIDVESIPLQKAMVDLGYCVNFVGPVRSAKTTYLQTWQSYEDPALEGIMVETDPEVPLHIRMPKAPIIQIIADGDALKKIMKPILRGDADYIIMQEARDALALNIAVEVASRGTRRGKSTFHITDPTDFCYIAADEIVKEFGGDLFNTIVKVAKAYNYVFSFEQLHDKSKKRLTGIHEIRYDKDKYEVSLHYICRYDYEIDDWTYAYDIGEDKREIGYKENRESFLRFEKELKRLSELKPMKENNVIIPAYGRLNSYV